MMPVGAKLGRIRPTEDQKRAAPRFMDFLKAPLPVDQAPAQCDNISGAPIAMNGNDQNGDCTVAGVTNLFAMWAHALGKPFVPVVAKVLAFYYELTGGADTGLPETIVLQKVMSDGIDCAEDGVPRKISVWVRVPTQNHAVMKFLIWKFKAVYLGVELSDNDCSASSWVPPASLVGKDANNPNNGHAILVGRYDVPLPDGDIPVGYVTWGMDMPGTIRWCDLRCDEGYVLLDSELAEAVGIDWEGMLSAMQNMPGT